MKRASYRTAIELIALNDDPAEMDPAVIACSVSVGIVADLFGVDVERVAKDVIRVRVRETREEYGRIQHLIEK